jgi:hypothetical protein
MLMYVFIGKFEFYYRFIIYPLIKEKGNSVSCSNQHKVRSLADRHNNVADLHRLLRSQHAIDSLPLNRKTMHILSQKDINM